MDIQQLVDMATAAGERDRMKSMITLGELVAALRAAPADMLVRTDQDGSMTGAHSYRGYYSDVAFEPTSTDVTVAELLEDAAAAIGDVFQGYKGGDYEMSKSTPVWLAEYSSCGREVVSAEVSDGVFQITTQEHQF